MAIRDYSYWFAADSPPAFGFVLFSQDAELLANFKYKLRPISNSEVNALAKAAKKKAKKVAKKK